ncbi:MAG TPA: radical SAM protein [Gemmatimonadales bacterium]|nr:radical SAM protein [Gemmatimonadales bacterium]
MAEPSRQLPLVDLDPPPARTLEVLDERSRGTRFLRIAPRGAINSPKATGMGFWSLNPYVGCEFACSYCYARDTHRHAVERARRAGALPVDPALGDMEPWQAFERRILVKQDLAGLLARTLDRHGLRDATLVIGTATDPYQPAERQFGVTRSVLEVLAARRGLRIGITTKSPLVVRDVDLLATIARRHRLSVNVSLATTDAALARRLEPRSPAPHARLRALARLRAEGIDAGLLVAPIVPLLTDSRAALRALFVAASAAGASFVWQGGALRLGPAARRRFLPHLEQEFPELAERYRAHFGTHTSATRAYRRALSRRVRRLQQEFGFTRGDDSEGVSDAAPPSLAEQLPLFEEELDTAQ